MALHIRQIVSGSFTFTGASMTQTISPALLDTSKAFIVANYRLTAACTAPDTGLIAYQIVDNNTISFYRQTSSGTINAVIEWWIVEANEGITVRRGSLANMTASPTAVTFDPLESFSESFVLHSAAIDGTSFTNSHFIRAVLDNAQQISFGAFGTGATQTLEWQAVRIEGARVQSGFYNQSVTTETTATIPIEAVDVARTFCTISTSAPSGTAANLAQKLQRGRVTNSTSFVANRQGSGIANHISWQVIELPATFSTRDFAATFSGTGTTIDTTIAAVDTSRSFLFEAGQYGMSGSTALTTPALISNAAFLGSFLSSTSVRNQRLASTSGNATVIRYVVEAPEPSFPATVHNATVSYGTGTIQSVSVDQGISASVFDQTTSGGTSALSVSVPGTVTDSGAIGTQSLSVDIASTTVDSGAIGTQSLAVDIASTTADTGATGTSTLLSAIASTTFDQTVSIPTAALAAGISSTTVDSGAIGSSSVSYVEEGLTGIVLDVGASGISSLSVSVLSSTFDQTLSYGAAATSVQLQGTTEESGATGTSVIQGANSLASTVLDVVVLYGTGTLEAGEATLTASTHSVAITAGTATVSGALTGSSLTTGQVGTHSLAIGISAIAADEAIDYGVSPVSAELAGGEDIEVLLGTAELLFHSTAQTYDVVIEIGQSFIGDNRLVGQVLDVAIAHGEIDFKLYGISEGGRSGVELRKAGSTVTLKAVHTDAINTKWNDVKI